MLLFTKKQNKYLLFKNNFNLDKNSKHKIEALVNTAIILTKVYK